MARTLAAGLPSSVTKLEDPNTRSLVTRFLRAIPSMIVAGSLMEAALAEALPEPPVRGR
jgi:hypothetical protein